LVIDFSFKKSKTHFNLINSYWVEPDLEHLKRLLREVIELPKFEIERRVERGRSLILDKFRWDNYRERTERFISNLDIDIPFKPKGRLVG